MKNKKLYPITKYEDIKIGDELVVNIYWNLLKIKVTKLYPDIVKYKVGGIWEDDGQYSTTVFELNKFFRETKQKKTILQYGIVEFCKKNYV